MDLMAITNESRAGVCDILYEIHNFELFAMNLRVGNKNCVNRYVGP
jgi:hypothetical protein